MTCRTIRQSDSRRPLSIWELPKLAMLVHCYRKSKRPAKKIRPHFPAVLAFIHRNRLATSDQVRRRFPQYLASDRTARRHLAEMESLELLGVQTVTNVSPLMPKPYFVTAAGLRLLRKSLADRGHEWTALTRDRKRGSGQSFPHVWHELATTEFLLSVWEAAKRRSDLELLLTERRSLANHPAFRVSILGRPVHLQPDAFFLARQSARGMTCCLLETDMGTESERQLAAKLEGYRVWAESAGSRDYLCETYRRFGAMSPAPLFRLVLVICGITARTADLRLALLLRLLRTQPYWFRQRVWAATAAAFQQHAADVLSAPVWVRFRDTRTESETITAQSRSQRSAFFTPPDIAEVASA